MVIDAMDILYSGKVNGFCLVTSDSDFTKLAIRLREAGMLVVGMGEQKTPSSLVAACETFKYLDLLYQDEGEEKLDSETINKSNISDEYNEPEQVDSVVTASSSDKCTDEVSEVQNEVAKGIPDKCDVGMEITAIIESISDENGWAFLGVLGNLLAKRIPGFDPRNYGFKKLKSFIESYDCYEIQETDNPKNAFLKLVYVKVK